MTTPAADEQSVSTPPLAGVRVVEFGSFIAGPHTTRILADFGADVIKIESPKGGDELRGWGETVETTDGPLSVWWLSAARNKRSVTLDLHKAAGQALARRLVEHSQIVVENFRPGKLEEWGLGY